MNGPTATFRAAALVAAALCLLALVDLPYGFYTLLRVTVTASAAYGALLAAGRGAAAWAVALGLLAALFNPVFPVYLDRGTWALVDVAAAVTLSAAAFGSAAWAAEPDSGDE